MKKESKKKQPIEKIESKKIKSDEFDSIVKAILQAPPEPKKKPKKGHK